MSRWSATYLFLILMCSLHIGSVAVAEEKPFTQPPSDAPMSIEEQIAFFEKKINRYERKSKKAGNPEKRALLNNMAMHLEKVKSFKVKELNQGTLSKEDRQELKEAYTAYREARNILKGREDQEVATQQEQDTSEPKRSKYKGSDQNTYETASGFKVRLKLP